MTFEAINNSLELQSWFVCEKFLSNDICNEFFSQYFQPESLDKFEQGRIGRVRGEQSENSIRSSKIQWIDDFNQNSNHQQLKDFFFQVDDFS